MKSVKISDDDPALIFDWNVDNLQAYVNAANASAAGAGKLPHFVSTTAGSMTPTSLTQDIVTYLCTAAGGRKNQSVLAPNNLVQYANVASLMGHIGCDPLVQSFAGGLSGPIGTVYVCSDRQTAIELKRPAPHNGGVQLFA